MRASSIVLIAMSLAALTAEAEWSAHKTEMAKVMAFNSQCVEIQLLSGKRVSLKRSGFKGVKLISGSTQVGIHPHSLDKSLCHVAAN